MNLADEHKKLYDAIPKMRCKSGCMDCCGPVLISRWEAQNIGDNGGALAPDKVLARLKIGLDMCPHAKPEGCAIYDKRPFICRLFGTVKDPILTCPHGCKPDEPLTKAQGLSLRKRAHELFDRKPPAP